MICDICKNEGADYNAPDGTKVHHTCWSALQEKLASMDGNKSAEDAKQEAMFNKIRGLLKKAENTPFEHEADAFIQKAQELMLRYRIDEEELWNKDPERRSKVTEIHISIGDREPGAMYKRLLLRTIAMLNSSRSWYTPGDNRATVAGFPKDLIWIEMLYTSVMTQGRYQMALAQATTGDGINTKVFRTNFWAGFQSRLSERLTEVYSLAQREVESTTGSKELVLTDRKAKVDNYVDSKYSFGQSRVSNHKLNHTARTSGNIAADKTDISGGRRSVKSSPKELGR